MKANATDLPPPTPASAPAPAPALAEAVTALYQAHALGLIRLAVVMLGDRPAAWTFPKAGVLAVNVQWSNSSGGLLIGVIPTTGDGRVGVISGNTFTPLPGQGSLTADQSGAW